MIISKSVRVAAHGLIPFFSTAEQHSLVCTRAEPPRTHSSVRGLLSGGLSAERQSTATSVERAAFSCGFRGRLLVLVSQRLD